MVSIATVPPRPPPLTALSKRPTSVKRDSSHFDVSSPIPSSPTKRLKVAFDDRVHVRIMDDWSDNKSFDLVKEEVRVAIKGHLAPAQLVDDVHYTRLLQLLSQNVLSPDAPSSHLLLKYLRALEARISSLGECPRLVSAVLHLSWLGRDEQFATFYTHFLLVLATAHIKYTGNILECLVSSFARLPTSSGRLPGHDVVSKDIMFERLHAAIQLIAKTIPLASAVLCEVIRDNSPNDLATSRTHLQYQQHLLQLAREIPEVQSEILAFLVQRIVSIDVQIQKDLDELEDDEVEELLPQQESTNTLPPADGDETEDSELDSASESESTLR